MSLETRSARKFLRRIEKTNVKRLSDWYRHTFDIAH